MDGRKMVNRLDWVDTMLYLPIKRDAKKIKRLNT
jgi:hypothetical protein